jgi:tetratricopeptide (TPR) repeat protein
MDQKRFDNAIALRDSGRIEDAAREFSLLATDTDNPNERAAILGNEMNCYCRLRRLADADKTLAQIRAIAPNDPRVRVSVDVLAAGLVEQKGELKKAVAQYDRVLCDYADLLKTPEYQDLCEDTQKRRAFISVNLHKCEEALPLLNLAAAFTTLNAEDVRDVHLYRGICYTELHDYDLAKREFLEAIDFGLGNDNEA